jgi:hypothetical protein
MLGKRPSATSATVLVTWMVLALGAGSCADPASPESQNSQASLNELRKLPFPNNYPTQETADRLYEEMLFHRATQVVLWSLPATTLWAMKKGSEAEFGAGSNVFPIWKDRLTADTLVSTPNSDVIYGMGYLDLKTDGPTVIEVPPKLQGILDDFWHRPLTDVGFVGPDKGEGRQVPDPAPGLRRVVRTATSPSGASKTYNVFVFWRAFSVTRDGRRQRSGRADGEDADLPARPKKDDPPEMKFPNGSKQPANMVYPKRLHVLRGTRRVRAEEAVDSEDWSMRGMMASLGIEKGKPFRAG